MRCHHCGGPKTVLRRQDPLCARCRATFRFLQLASLEFRYATPSEAAPGMAGPLNRSGA